jgi:DNA transformation protein and related proteins
MATPRTTSPKATAQEAEGAQRSIASLANLGPKSAEFLAAAGIRSLEELAALGSVAAFVKVKSVEPKASLNLLWALEGALTGLHWREVAKEHRTSLLLALESHEQQFKSTSAKH